MRSDPTPSRSTASRNPAAARPLDAASLVLVRGAGRETEVLLGRREPRDRFMPDVYVFPGGRVDRRDAFQAAASELRGPVARKLAKTASPQRARALGVAAIRETHEETGLLLGRSVAAGIEPDLKHLEFVARAITPVRNPIRYHARFFAAEASALFGELRGNGELLDLAWVPIPKALELRIIDVTAFVLREVAARASGQGAKGVPLAHYRGMQLCIRRD